MERGTSFGSLFFFVQIIFNILLILHIDHSNRKSNFFIVIDYYILKITRDKFYEKKTKLNNWKSSTYFINLNLTNSTFSTLPKHLAGLEKKCIQVLKKQKKCINGARILKIMVLVVLIPMLRQNIIFIFIKPLARHFTEY